MDNRSIAVFVCLCMSPSETNLPSTSEGYSFASPDEGMPSTWLSQLVPGVGRILNNKTVWIVVLVIVAILRGWLVSKDGIIPIKYDSRNYTLTSYYLFEQSNTAKLPTHRSGLAITAWVTTQFGIPYKMFLDGMILIAAGFAGFMIHRLLGSFLAGLSVCLAIAFSPWFIMFTQVFMTEPLTSILLLSIFLLSIQMLVKPFHQWSIWQALSAGVATALFDLTRNEGPLLLLFWFAVLIVVVIRQRKDLFTKRVFKDPNVLRLSLVAVPVVMSFLSLEALKRYNGKKFGIYAVCCTEAEGFSELMDALYSITPEKKLRFAPVTSGAMSEACKVSPTLNKYSDRLLDSSRGSFAHCKRRTGYDNQFGTWLNWHLMDSFSGVSVQSNADMLQAAKEIREAQEKGDLPKRFGKFPIHPYWQEWSKDIPGLLVQAFKNSLFKQTFDSTKHLHRERLRDSADEAVYNFSLLRRNGTGLTREVHISGRMQQPNCAADFVRLLDRDGNLITSARVLFDDYDKRFIFSIVLDEIEYENMLGPLTLYFVDNDSESGRFRSNSVIVKNKRMMGNSIVYQPFGNESSSADNVADKPADEFWYISSVRHRPDRGKRVQVKNSLKKNYHWLLWSTIALGLVAGMMFRGSRRRYYNVLWIAVAALVFVFARNLLYSLLDAWVGWGVRRYVEPNNFLFLFGLVCLAFVVGRQLVRFFGVPYSDADDQA